MIWALVDDIIDLRCSVDANPAVTEFSWWYGNATVDETGDVLTINTSSNESAFGVYTCRATNAVGSSPIMEFTLGNLEMSASAG